MLLSQQQLELVVITAAGALHQKSLTAAPPPSALGVRNPSPEKRGSPIERIRCAGKMLGGGRGRL